MRVRVAIAAITLLGIGASLQAAPLKWKPYRPNTQQQLEQSAKPRTEAENRKIKQVAAQAPADSDPLSDPFEDDAKPLRGAAEDAVEDRFPLEPEPEQVEQEPAATDDLKPTDDFFPGDPVPEMKRPQAEREDEPTEPKLPPADSEPQLPAAEPQPQLTDPSLSDEIRDPQYYDKPTDIVGCKLAKADCADALAKLKSNTLANIDLNIAISGVEGQDFPCECAFGEGETFEGRNWTCVTYNWKASGLCHKPLYFEQVAVERYGHSLPTLVQDVLCGVHFFASVPALPYMMGLCPPDECQYSLGYYRPGNCAPYLIDPIPLSLRAGLFQAGAIAGGILIIP